MTTETDHPTDGFDIAGLACPAPRAETERILLGHGSGGQLSAELLRTVILPALGDAAAPGALEDAAVVRFSGPELVVSTDSFVVTPLFFPGGDIGALAVNGTINDVAMMGAMPVALTLAFVIEEGFPVDELRRVCESVGASARRAGVPVVTGDTKVVGRGAADGLFITTTGIGRRLAGAAPSATLASTGDAVIVSGPIGRHGVTVLSTRVGLGFESDIESDSQPLHRLVQAIIGAGGTAVHVMRDPTRGGLSSSLNEIAQSSGVEICLDEASIPVPPTVAAACEMLGLDPLHVANEGCLVAIVAESVAHDVLTAMHADPAGHDAVVIGRVTDGTTPRVTMRTSVGATRVVDMLVGEQLPRIC
jgi:hydrogenase expression/formation protein HypE